MMRKTLWHLSVSLSLGVESNAQTKGRILTLSIANNSQDMLSLSCHSISKNIHSNIAKEDIVLSRRTSSRTMFMTESI